MGGFISYYYYYFPADVRVFSFIFHASTSSRHYRRCGTALTVFRRALLVVWIVLGPSARRSARGRKDTIETCIVIMTQTLLSLAITFVRLTSNITLLGL
jgi:hypothetical protein